MIRSLTLIDAARIAVLKGSDWAVRPKRLTAGRVPPFAPAAFLWDRSRLRRRSATWISAERWKITGLVSARLFSGPTVWMVDHLVTSDEAQESGRDLLERAGAHAARRRAQRLFLYLPDEWRLLEMARQSGFVPCHQSYLLTLPGRGPLLGVEPVQGLRPRTSVDDLALFRLYNASTPAEVRAAAGLTLQEWKDAQEPRRRGIRELVLEVGGGAKGWIRLEQHRNWTWVRLMTHPHWDGDQRGLVAAILAAAGSRRVWWEVPEFQADLRLLLERVGFEVAGCYCLAVKTLAARVRQPLLAPVPTSG